jgi:outer membrane protein assembly factor BamB
MLAGSPAWAVIEKAPALKDVLADAQFIFTVKVDAIDADKPAAVLLVDDDLKDKAPFRRLPVNLKGDAEAEKAKHTPQLLKRLAPKLPLVVFVIPRGKTYVVFCYTDGTWFQMRGVKDGEALRWAFNHCEPYLRQTFKGSTQELKQIVVDGLSGKKDPPEPNRKEKPGFGPEVEDKNTGKQGDKQVSAQIQLLFPNSVWEHIPRNSVSSQRLDAKQSFANGRSQTEFGNEGMKTRILHASPRLRVSVSPCLLLSSLDFEPTFSVIPSVLVGGPLAVLAMLFPTVFGGWKRWLALISVACTLSTLYFVQWLFAGELAGTWWGSPTALWLGMSLVTLAGMLWAWQRHATRVRDGHAVTAPGGVETTVLAVLSAIGLGTVIYHRNAGESLLAPSWLPFCIGAWVALLYALFSRWSQRATPALAAEGVLLTAMAFTYLALGAVLQPHSMAGTGEVIHGESQAAADTHVVKPGRLVWTFRAPGKGSLASSPLVAGDRIYFGVALGGFAPYGEVYCLDRKTGKPIWTFNDDEQMKAISISSPYLAEGRLYIGEGYHQDSHCKLYCLNADNGEKLWEFQTDSHTESSPCVAGGKVYCGAGDDGLYCLDAASGKELWRFPGFHIDASPVVAEGRVFIGAGIGDVHRETALFCLDADWGKLLWRLNIDLPAWAAPAVRGPHVYFGIGNGRMDHSDDSPAGALVCVEAATGHEVWRYPVADGVLAKPVADGQLVYFGSRDGNLYCVTSADGKLSWKYSLGGPMVAAPVVARCSCCGARTSVFALAGNSRGFGRLYCLGANEGRLYWSSDLATLAQAPVELFSTPALTVPREATQEGRCIYVGATIAATARSAVLYCFEDRVESE